MLFRCDEDRNISKITGRHRHSTLLLQQRNYSTVRIRDKSSLEPLTLFGLGTISSHNYESWPAFRLPLGLAQLKIEAGSQQPINRIYYPVDSFSTRGLFATTVQPARGILSRFRAFGEAIRRQPAASALLPPTNEFQNPACLPGRRLAVFAISLA